METLLKYQGGKIVEQQKWQQVINLCNQFAQEQECTFAMQGFIMRLQQIVKVDAEQAPIMDTENPEED